MSWRRRSRMPTVFMSGLVVGVVVAALAIPSHSRPKTAQQPLAAAGAASGAAAAATGSDAGTPSTPGGAAASGNANTNAVASAPTGGKARIPAAKSAPSAGAATQTANAAPRAASSGAPSRGITADKVTIGFANLDSSSLTPVCPRCGDGAGADGAAANALVAAWRKDGMLPVNGRDLDVVNIKYNVLSSEDERNACLQMAQQVHPLLVGGVSMTGALDQCLAQENHLFTMDGEASGDEKYLNAVAPYAWQLMPSYDRIWRNWPTWANEHGLLKGQVLGLYSPDDGQMAGAQEDLDASFRAQLHQLGYKLDADVTYGQAPNDTLAVQRFRAAGVTVAFIVGTLTEPSGFQNVAQQQGYQPKYLASEVTGNETVDAVADVSYNASAEDANLALRTQFFDFSQRKPPVPINNDKAAYCINAYDDYTHRTLDVYDNDAEIRYAFSICSILYVVRDTLARAGPDLTDDSFLQSLYQTKGLSTPSIVSVSFNANKHAGGDDYADALFNKSRWQPMNNYFKTASPWTPFPIP